MARREIKLSYSEKYLACPHCHTDLVFGTVMGTITQSRRTCPNCGKEILIENNVPKKPPKSARK